MKKTIKYLPLAAVVFTLGVTTSCSREEDDIWDQSAVERLEAAQRDYYSTLCSAPNGWEMYYFVGSGEQGYNFLVKFEEGDKVTIATRNTNTSNAYAEETSAFDILIDDGPVLSFNSYNTLFHYYADPQPDHNVESDGVGKGGDYEFKLMSVSSDYIYMRGKKHGCDIYMYPLPAETNWEQYFDDIYAMRNNMFSSSISTLSLTLADGVRYNVDNQVSSQIMSFVPEGGDAVTQTTSMSYIVTPNGFRFMQSCPSTGGAPVREFVWNEDGTYLVGTDFGDCDAGAVLKAPAFATLLTTAGLDWRSYPEDLNGTIATAYQDVVDGFNEFRSTYKLQYLHYYFNVAGRPCVGLYVLAGRNRFEYVFYGDITVNDDNTVVLSFNGDGDTNAISILPDVPAISGLLSTISGTFVLSSESEINPKAILLTNSNNAADSFNLVLQ